jgi:hypothetical protein
MRMPAGVQPRATSMLGIEYGPPPSIGLLP